MFNFIGALNGRAYVVVALFTSAVLVAIAQFDSGGNFAGFFRGIGDNASRAGLSTGIVNIILEPIVLAVSDPIAAVVAGVLWPLLLLWFVLLVLVLVFAFMSPLINEAMCAIGDC